jgi:hypothetical protein
MIEIDPELSGVLGEMPAPDVPQAADFFQAMVEDAALAPRRASATELRDDLASIDSAFSKTVADARARTQQQTGMDGQPLRKADMPVPGPPPPDREEEFEQDGSIWRAIYKNGVFLDVTHVRDCN